MKPITFVSDVHPAQWPDDPIEVRVFTDCCFICFDEAGFSVTPLTKKDRTESIKNHRRNGWHEV